MEISKQIKKYRLEANLSQEELAEKIFVTRQTISNWENSKNYPDINSLILLSHLFGISLDILVKGDLQTMKEKIEAEVFSEEEVDKFKRDSNIFTVFLLLTIILPIPLLRFMGIIGLGIYGIIAAISIYYAIRVEKYKKNFNIQTYREILAFVEGKNLDDIEKNQEYGKRPYQKFLLAMGAGLMTLIVAVIMFYIVS